MIKISALNKEGEEETRSEEEVTREALEQIALQQYSKALELQRKGNLSDATQLLKDLLETELLEGVKKPAAGEKVVGPLFNLKYLSYKNLASMLSAADDVDGAIEAYGAAAELDDTDITLWHRLGLLCMRAARYEMALHAFQRGLERNPKHWPCLDKIVTLLLGLDYKEECISTIYETLQLDPGYMRGLVYRKHIYSNYPHVRNFMEYLNPIYKWDDKDDIIDGSFEKLLKEAEQIHEKFIEQQRADQFKCMIPHLKLQKSITQLSWESVGESLVDMHNFMTDNSFSHACPIQIVFEESEQSKTIEVCEEVADPLEDSKVDNISAVEKEKNSENVSENINNYILDKVTTIDTEKIENDVEMLATEAVVENLTGPKKKPPARRRGSALSFLQQWEWCTKRRSGRKKPVNRQDRLDDNIYDTLRRMVPLCLVPEVVKKCEEETVPDLSINSEESELVDDTETYFGSEHEQLDVKQFIEKYTENRKDIIDILYDYLLVLAKKWKVKWPESLPDVFIAANVCYNKHIDPPACTDDNQQNLIHYTAVNLLVEEFLVNEKLKLNTDEKHSYDLSVTESIKLMLTLKPHIFPSTDLLEFTLRLLWVKLHIHILNKSEEYSLDCLYQLTYEFEAIGEYKKTYCLHIVNFTFKPNIGLPEILEYINFLERNRKLSTVLDLYERGNYEEVLSIVLDSFEHYKDMAKNQDEEMSLDFAVQLSLILDTYWALDKVDICFKWSLICLHEALTHYFRFTSGSSDYKKWTLTVVKILTCMEHILTTEGLTSLEAVSRKELSQGLEDLIRIIGHQVETNAAEMPFGTVIPWTIMHFILQREEDQGRGRAANDKDSVSSEEVPNPLMLLFIAHEQLGNRGWCCKNDGKLLYFILDTVVPRVRSPSLSKCLEQVCQHMEQCVYCLFGHPGKKNKLKYLTDHNVSPHDLDWKRAQQVYEIFRPPTLPALEGKISGITADTEQLFHTILSHLPPDCNPQKYVLEIERYIKGIEKKLPSVPPLLPYKMKDIYFLLGDYYFKKEEGKLAIKFNILDVIVNNDRLESWAQISLAKAVNLERILNSCKNLNNEREFLNPAKAIIRCFKRSLELDPTHCNMWIEYGIFVYTVHSFCSRLLKQASESLSMEDFEALEKQKEDMLDTTHKCFMTVLNDQNNSDATDKSNEDAWLHYYMLGKVSEKRNRPPSEYLNYYMQGVKSLQETDATYPLKINYSSPTHLCIEVLELHYRIHASILKYIEQHENKPIPVSMGKVFSTCIEDWKNGPFTKKPKKDGSYETEMETKQNELVLAGNIFKRSASDVGEEETIEAKKLKIETAAAKVKRSASYDSDKVKNDLQTHKPMMEPEKAIDEPIKGSECTKLETEVTKIEKQNAPDEKKIDDKIDVNNIPLVGVTDSCFVEQKPVEAEKKQTETVKKQTESQKKPTEATKKRAAAEKKGESSNSSSSSSSSGSSSSESSSDSSSDSSRDSVSSTISSAEKPLTDEEIMKIVSACLDALEDCASRFPPHYKAIYRLAHYHFYYKKGKDIERCRDLMLSNFTSRAGQKLGGLFSERKPSNFFNNIWKIPLSEVDRAGGFAFHMSRSVLLSMEILKEIDDHKTLLDLSLHLQRIPEPDKKYLRDADREELAQQAFSLCVQSLKGQLLKFSQQADLKSNDVERQALKSLMLDIYRAYQRAQKQPNSKQFTNLLIDAYKLVSTVPITENMNLVDLSMKYCQSLIQTLKQQATQASLDKSQNTQKKQTAKTTAETAKPTSATNQPKTDNKAATAPVVSSAALSKPPKMSAHEMATAFQSFLPVLSDPMLSPQTAAALTYLNNMNAFASYPSIQSPLQPSLQSSLQNSFQAEFYRQFITQSLASYLPPQKPKQKRGPKPGSTPRSAGTNIGQLKTSKSFNTPQSVTKLPPSLRMPGYQKQTPVSTLGHQKPTSGHQRSTSAPSSKFSLSNPKSTSTSGMSNPKSTLSSSLSSHQKTMPTLAPSMGTVLSSLPASMTANLSSFGAPSSLVHSNGPNIPSQAHTSKASTLTSAIPVKPLVQHVPFSSGKTLQEKLAERQKSMPAIALNKLPSSLTITKTSVPKVPASKSSLQPRKSQSFGDNGQRPKPTPNDEVIVLDD